MIQPQGQLRRHFHARRRQLRNFHVVADGRCQSCAEWGREGCSRGLAVQKKLDVQFDLPMRAGPRPSFTRMNHSATLLLFFIAIPCLGGCSKQPSHGRVTSSSIASSHDWQACKHGVPDEVCVRCRPEKAAEFKAKGDWCPEHDVAESQCLECNPDLDFSPPEDPPPGSDVVQIVKGGEALPDFEEHLVAGKVTVFDFYASWCPPCRKVDSHLYRKLMDGENFAIRRIDVVSWDSPVAEQYLREVPELPLVVVYGADGVLLGKISGAELEEIDRLILNGSP
jgi:thiol-disulfide isomerase/thioredoxin